MPSTGARVRHIRVVLLTAVLVAAVLSVGAFAVVRVADTGSEPTGSRSRGRTATPTPTGAAPRSSAPAPPDRAGLVTYTAVAGDDRAAEIATLFDSYFSAINAGDYDRALTYYDPAGQVDTSDPAERADFAEGVATSTDTDVVVRSLTGDPSDGNLVATVSFTSQQAADKAPNGQTCAHWTVAYTLTRPDGGYRIFKGTASHDGCY